MAQRKNRLTRELEMMRDPPPGVALLSSTFGASASGSAASDAAATGEERHEDAENAGNDDVRLRFR